jgi:protein-tyrosine phosphatase
MQVSSFDFHWIVPDLAQGAFPGEDSIGRAGQFDKSIFSTFDVVVLCAEELQPRIQSPPGKEIFNLPMDDDIYRPVPEEVADILHDAAKRLTTYCAYGHKVLTTCAEGRNRSGIITALILMYGYSMPPTEAIKLIRRKRPKGCLGNPMFEQFLLTTPLR